jgi:hypothetical protein
MEPVLGQPLEQVLARGLDQAASGEAGVVGRDAQGRHAGTCFAQHRGRRARPVTALGGVALRKRMCTIHQKAR